MVNIRFLLAIIVFFFVLSETLLAQDEITGNKLTEYPFINYPKNTIQINDSLAWRNLFNKLGNVSTRGTGKVSIVHIGDSHLQADYFPGAVRKNLQTYFLGTLGGRGFIFPYRMANTNNPVNYRVHWRGNWDNCRAVQPNFRCKLGLSGIALTTTDTTARIDIGISDPTLPYYDFDRLMLFFEISPNSYIPEIQYPANQSKITIDSLNGFVLFEFPDNVDSVSIVFKKQKPGQNSFTLYGLNFDSSDPGIIYHTIGINGARIESYLKCDYFIPHLRALNPDLVIISLGTNDSYSYQFDSIKFESEITQMVSNIRQANPGSAILFTTPGDNRIHKRNINPSTIKASRTIIHQADELNYSYWDFNTIMGGPGSASDWNNEGLGHTDFLHFTRKGYEYQAKLFFIAFMEAYGQYLNNDPLTRENQ
jgi:hypothetical protein